MAWFCKEGAFSLGVESAFSYMDTVTTWFGVNVERRMFAMETWKRIFGQASRSCNADVLVVESTTECEPMNSNSTKPLSAIALKKPFIVLRAPQSASNGVNLPIPSTCISDVNWKHNFVYRPQVINHTMFDRNGHRLFHHSGSGWWGQHSLAWPTLE